MIENIIFALFDIKGENRKVYIGKPAWLDYIHVGLIDENYFWEGEQFYSQKDLPIFVKAWWLGKLYAEVYNSVSEKILRGNWLLAACKDIVLGNEGERVERLVSFYPDVIERYKAISIFAPDVEYVIQVLIHAEKVWMQYEPGYSLVKAFIERHYANNSTIMDLFAKIKVHEGV